jgi:hypothetical protein
MPKLKLESLHVTSFVTSAVAPQSSGTVQAHAAAPTHTCATWELGCGLSGLDCSYTCTKMISCPGDPCQ